ncbi:MAG: 50S ribosomal protein L6 [Gammaproteobacteria bacterium]|nr:50S ribosomal protein L6 [Gammaproteobacteria bacterium]
MVSRVARKPIDLPSNVKIQLTDRKVVVNGPKGSLTHTLPEGVNIKHEENQLTFSIEKDTKALDALSGTSRAIINNIIIGVVSGYEIKLLLVGVGYRAQLQGNTLNLTLGFSHPVKFVAPAGIVIESPMQTEVLVKGIDKHLVGQVAANIRRFRKPEKYKGKGIRYANETIALKEVKKK